MLIIFGTNNVVLTIYCMTVCTIDLQFIFCFVEVLSSINCPQLLYYCHNIDSVVVTKKSSNIAITTEQSNYFLNFRLILFQL